VHCLVRPRTDSGGSRFGIKDEAGIFFRVLYVASLKMPVYVACHLFSEETQRTRKSDLDLASKRYAELVRRAKAIALRHSKGVWDCEFEDDPAKLRNEARSALMMAISEYVKAKGLNQTERRRSGFAVSQAAHLRPDAGQGFGMFSIDTLVAMLARAGIEN